MKKRVTIGLTILIVAVFCAGIVWRLFRRTEPSPQEARLAEMVRRAVLDNDLSAAQAVRGSFEQAKPEERIRIRQECYRRVMQGLNSRDNVLWRPYNRVQTNTPSFLRRILKPWQEPRNARRSAASWLCLSGAWHLEVLSPPRDQQVSVLLMNLAKNDPDPSVRRTVFSALGDVGCFSQEALQMMLDALGHANPHDRQAATRWFARHTVVAEKVVPALLRGLEDDAMRSDYASALRAYGPKAEFVVEPLLLLARTNNPSTSSVAKWALAGIDPEAFKRAGIKW